MCSVTSCCSPAPYTRLVQGASKRWIQGTVPRILLRIMHKLSSKCARGSATSRYSAVCALLVLVLTTSGSAGCIWLDDFGKFKIGDAGPRDLPDARADGSDAAADSATSERCKDVDCSDLDGECTKGVCNPASGKCEPQAAKDGTACFDANPCTVADTCNDGECLGEALDCSALDDDCSQGMCDPETGGCTFGPTSTSQSCNDLNGCTLNDRCTGDPDDLCRGELAPSGTVCDDFYSCTGTDAAPDKCDDKGMCQAGAPVAAGTRCDDDNECTISDRCDGEGVCDGDATREGEPCQQACASNTICQDGECSGKDGAVVAYNNQCLTSFCGISNICQDKWKTDQVCQCGCGYEDSACSSCSSYMCQGLGDHKAARWCDSAGKPSSNCPDSLKNDGKCDCGCQFEDPDCNGGACCSGTSDKGCENSFVEDCVCNNKANGNAECCTNEWTDRCAELAVNLGCMICP